MVNTSLGMQVFEGNGADYHSGEVVVTTVFLTIHSSLLAITHISTIDDNLLPR
jgi:hypothetical protein